MESSYLSVTWECTSIESMWKKCHTKSKLPTNAIKDSMYPARLVQPVSMVSGHRQNCLNVYSVFIQPLIGCSGDVDDHFIHAIMRKISNYLLCLLYLHLLLHWAKRQNKNLSPRGMRIPMTLRISISWRWQRMTHSSSPGCTLSMTNSWKWLILNKILFPFRFFILSWYLFAITHLITHCECR